MTTHESTDVAERIYGRFTGGWDAHDADMILSVATDDVHWADPGWPVPLAGRTEARRFLQSVFATFPDLRFAPLGAPHLVAEGGVVATAWTMSGTMRGVLQPQALDPTGRRFSIMGVDWWTLRDGAIAEYRTFYDVAGVGRQLGLVPRTGGRVERMMSAAQRCAPGLTARLLA